MFLPAEFHGQGSLVDYSWWVCKELDTTERTHIHTVTLCLPFWEMLKLFFMVDLLFCVSPAVYKDSNFSFIFAKMLSSVLFILMILVDMNYYPVFWNCFYLVTNAAEHLHLCKSSLHSTSFLSDNAMKKFFFLICVLILTFLIVSISKEKIHFYKVLVIYF